MINKLLRFLDKSEGNHRQDCLHLLSL